jgi:response regulator RpfG family c-di-GMP phosphodiesterase
MINEMIVIRGKREAIMEVQSETIKLVSHGIRELPYTHFLSFPLTLKLLVERVGEFQRQSMRHIRSKQQGHCDKSIFMKLEKLHLTIGMMKLFSEAEIERACHLLQRIIPDITKLLNNHTLMIRLFGIDVMKGQPGKKGNTNDPL